MIELALFLAPIAVVPMAVMLYAAFADVMRSVAERLIAGISESLNF